MKHQLPGNSYNIYTVTEKKKTLWLMSKEDTGILPLPGYNSQNCLTSQP